MPNEQPQTNRSLNPKASWTCRASVNSNDTSIPGLFYRVASELGDQHLFIKSCKKESPQEFSLLSWEEGANQVAKLAHFLSTDLGVKKGDPVAILSLTRAEWAIADLAILAIGAVSIPIYHSLVDPEVAYVLYDSEAKVIFSENQSQLEKLRAVTSQEFLMPESERPTRESVKLELQHIISFETVETKDIGAQVHSLGDIINNPDLDHVEFDGKKSLETLPPLTRDDLASIVYTSGTTGAPKGVMQSHGNHLAMLESLQESKLMASGQDVFLFLPLAHSFARLVLYGVLATGGSLNLPSVVSRTRSDFSSGQLFKDISASQPKILPAVPRIYEKIKTSIEGEAQSDSLKGKVLAWALKNSSQESGSAKAWLANKVLEKVKTKVFGNRLEYCISGGAPLDKDVAVFLDKLGILVLEGYGLTETSPALSANTLEFNRFGTVGKVFPGVQVEVAEDGELLAAGGNIALGYHKRPEATAKTWLNGWFHTGDIAKLDNEGYISITDRKKDIIVNAGGKNIAPVKIEGMLKNISIVSQAIVYGDKEPYLVGLLTLDPENAIVWAKNNLANWDKDLASLSTNETLIDHLKGEIKKVNKNLASYEEMKRFDILAEDLSIENGLLSPTLKPKRREIYRRFKDQLLAIYDR